MLNGPTQSSWPDLLATVWNMSARWSMSSMSSMIAYWVHYTQCKKKSKDMERDWKGWIPLWFRRIHFFSLPDPLTTRVSSTWVKVCNAGFLLWFRRIHFSVWSSHHADEQRLDAEAAHAVDLVSDQATVNGPLDQEMHKICAAFWDIRIL